MEGAERRMIWAIALFALTLLIGMPIAFVLAITGIVHISTMNISYFSVIPQRMFAGINVTSLMCIPFFIVAGELMNGGGVTKRLLDFVREVIGGIRGGLAYATVFTAMILSAILGSANAVASILCSVLIPDLKKDGYKEEFAGALIAASGVLGPIIPPSTTFVYYSVLSGASVKGLFMAGIVPGILIGLAYCIVIANYVRKYDPPKAIDKIDFRRMGRSFLAALPALLVPFVIVGGVMAGVFTPTESGAVACVIAIMAGFLYRGLNVRNIPRMMLRAGMASSSIMFIIACGNILGWSMAVGNVPKMATDLILSITTNKNMVIAIMLVLMVIIGCLMEATAAQLIFTPVLLSLVAAVGMDELHFGLIFCVMMVIALVTPPVGMTLFVTANISQIELSRISRAILPFCAAAIGVVVVLAYCPDIVLFLPRVFLGYK
jgi:tripartite ATP-independent transporter DctM subunit